ncbi:hypothetical protein Ana3638_21725 [Anaerocolumna sedimenticola]|uniref:Fibronectin type III-like domain-containing protein n=1 Tax=Anaerocolumna sedimenticola TaxID=2696063 RepID=A0A6P1TSZ0_9FIRM|nr:glycoside hydrolase family 3 N-terminal domain-containing protein [Anaerocolumna sedimenticola]QHQ63071.1 hypothetical protein Ana3638_21725 [Anaerocolumna sedimenticola]
MDIVKLLNEMTIEEKVAQLSGGSFKQILDLKTLRINNHAKERMPYSVGHLDRVGGSTDLTPREIAMAANELQRYFVEETRLGIPVLLSTEGTSGVLSRNYTLFPGNLNTGAMFDEHLTYEMGKAIGKELRAAGENWVLAPVVDTIREFRYGRYEESYGEDIYLVARNGVEYVKGLQGDLKTGAAATLKHYVAQGISDGGRNTAPVHLGQRELLNEYLVPFEACVKEANPATIMAAYHEIDGIPTHASKYLLLDILREKLGFEGLTVSDGNGIQLVNHFQEYCGTLNEAASLCINAGIDLELDDVYRRFLISEAEKGTVSMERIDEAVLRVLTLKEQLGLFENPYVDIDKVDEIVMCGKHLNLAYEMAVNSIILLKNQDRVLPVAKGKKIGLVGPLSNRKDFAYGDYSYPTHIKEVYYACAGLSEDEILARSAFSASRIKEFDELYHDTATIYEELKIRYTVVQRDLLRDTYNYYKDPKFEDYELDDELLGCDVLVAVLGETSGMGYENDTGESTDRTEITLSKEQRNLLAKLKKTGKPLILILANAKPVELSIESDLCDGIMEAFKTGYYGARAICDVLDGSVSPGGKLPVTIPKHIGQCPIYYSQRITGKKQFWRNKYLEMDLNPLYEFGFGLSYTDFIIDVSDFTCKGDSVCGEVRLKNIGDRAGSEVIQLYVKKRFGTISQPERELKFYKKVYLKPGEECLVPFCLRLDSLAYYNIDMDYCLEDSEVTVMIGTSSKEILKEETYKLEFPGGKKLIKEKVFNNNMN